MYRSAWAGSQGLCRVLARFLRTVVDGALVML